jgi:hypothetical protein
MAQSQTTYQALLSQQEVTQANYSKIGDKDDSTLQGNIWDKHALNEHHQGLMVFLLCIS